MTDTPNTSRCGPSRLVLGIFLLLLGAFLLALNLGVQVPWDLWEYFPFVLVALGLWGLIRPTPHIDRPGGVWLLATGLYCLIGMFHWFGLGWATAWPIFIVATGVGLMVPSVAPRSRGCKPAHEPTETP
jgi:hypothetical protein